jgi:predicted nucleic acid-binding protein
MKFDENSLVFLDTHILIWSIKEEATLGQEQMIPKAKKLLDDILKSQSRAVISSIVVSEFLTNIPSSSMLANLQKIQETFMVVPFDVKSALMCAKIWQENQDSKLISDLKELGVSNRKLKADCMIVASAVAYKANCIYSHDKYFKKFAEGFIPVFRLDEGRSRV